MLSALLLMPLVATAGVTDVRADTVRLLVMDTSGGSGAEKDLVRLIDGSIAEALSRPPSFDVVTRADIQQLVDLEAQKAAMSCDATSCLAEVASALGARYVVYGVLTIIDGASESTSDDVWVVQLNLVDAQEGKAIARQSARGNGALEASDNAKKAVARLTVGLLEPGDTSFSTLLGESAPEPEPEPASPPDPLLLAGAGTATVGAAALATGLVLVGLNDEVFNAPERPLAERQRAKGLLQAGSLTAVAGGVVLAAGAGLLAWSIVSPGAE